MRVQTTNWQAVGQWLRRLLGLDFSVFDEIRMDKTATLPALTVVLGASVLAGFGSWIWALQHTELRGVDAGEVLVKSLVLGSIVQTLVWFLWVYFVYFVLFHGYRMRVDFGQLTRTMGFAFAPVALNVFVGITVLAVPFGVLAFVAAVLFANVAIEKAAGTELRETMLANLVGFAVFVVVMGVFANIAKVGVFGGIAPGILFFSLSF